MEYLKKYKEWCNNDVFDEETKSELKQIENNDEEIKDRFYKDLEFGTAGLRGVIGIGTNRMNKYTVGKAAQGLANYIVEKAGQKAGVAIAYDSRNMSKEFGELSAQVLNANGIKTYLFDGVRPTPELSFAVRKLGCIAGIVITASHNPPKYNGYKVYWKDGAQIFGEVAEGISEKVKRITDFAKIKKIDKKVAIEAELYNIIGKNIDDDYVKTLKGESVYPEIIRKYGNNLKIVYTPLHGTGYMLAKRALTEIGFTNFNVVESQKEPDGNFPTVKYPNPEAPKAFELALDLAKKIDADIVAANDPDADRIGLYVKDNRTGEYIHFSGNMTGNLLAEYLISQKKERGELKENTALIKSIVTSKMANAICNYYGITIFEVLTGFKNIAAKIRDFERENTYNCVISYEESYGSLVGNYARDKDGIMALMILCEAATFYKNQGLTLWDKMQEMYKKYGCYKEDQIGMTLEGSDGAKKIQEIMEKLRKNPIENIGNYKVVKIDDYSICESKNLLTGKREKIDSPISDVVYYELENDNWVCARPSGTEPKIKFYVGAKGLNLEKTQNELEELKEAMKSFVK